MLRQTIAELIVLFFCYSVAGWCMEVILKYIQFHRFINRGFLIGPYCPIYGSGAVVVTVLVGGLIGNASYIVTFLASFVLCGVLEYFVSWYMEKMFHARWWDYSQKPMNLHGRIWIGNLVLFGIGGVAIVKLIDPVLMKWIHAIPQWILYTLSGAIVMLMIWDNIVSHIAFTLWCDHRGKTPEKMSVSVFSAPHRTAQKRYRFSYFSHVPSAVPGKSFHPAPKVRKVKFHIPPHPGGAKVPAALFPLPPGQGC